MAGAHVKRTTQGFKGTGTSSTNPIQPHGKLV